ncbi:MAG: mechanosensitive ion channel [Sphingobacteriaceae bacterium]|nr:MAG: mechanosensitive ion channel [Sphingobacteriaceae bacterium]
MTDYLQNLSDRLPPYAWNLLILLTAVLIGLLLKFIIIRLMVFYQNQSDYSTFKSIITHLGRPATWFIPLLVLNLLLSWMILSDKFLQVFSKVLQISLTISLAVLLIRTISVFEDYVYHAFDMKKTDNLKERKIRTQLQFLRKIGIALIIILTIATILLSFENMRRIGSYLITSVGIGGIIVGFAAQKSLGNLFAGFQIAFTQPIRMDDVLVVESEWGRVEEITLTYVVLRIWDQRRLILPITYFIEKPFQNWTRISAEILGTVFIHADYTLPIQPIRDELTRLLESNPLWDNRVNVLQVTDSKENTIELRALMSASDSSRAFDLRCFVRENLVTFIQQNYPESLPKTRAVVSIAADEGKRIL